MHHQSYFDLSQASDSKHYKERLLHFGGALGFELVNSFMVVEHTLHSPSVLYVGNRPATFESISTDPQLVRTDPVIHRLKNQSVPFMYDQSTYTAGGAAAIWELSAPYGYRTGICVASHLPNGRHFVLSLSRRKALPKTDTQLARLFGDLMLIAVHAQEGALRMLDAGGADDHESIRINRQHSPEAPSSSGRSERPPTKALTGRQKEALKWVLAGKTAYETALIMSISERTVRKFLTDASETLGCVGKLSTALKAQRFGYLA